MGLTDNEIKKALERCADGSGTGLIKATLDLINRQEADNTVLLGKIEGLEANRVELLENIEQLESVITQIKAEAYKEFAEKVLKDLALLAKHEDSFRQSVILGVCSTIKFKLKDLVGKADDSTTDN